MTYEESESELPAIPEGRNCARIMGVKRELFVEFEFFAGDPTLSVELILPINSLNISYRFTATLSILRD